MDDSFYPDEQIPYRAPVTAPVPDHILDRDDEDYSTLVDVKKILDKSIEDLSKDFNSFKLLEDATDKEVTDKIVRQIGGRQAAYDILVPIQSLVNSAVQNVEQRRKDRAKR